MDNYIGNITTIIKMISMIIAGYALGLAASYNLDLGVDAATLSTLIGAILFFILSYLDAKYPNNFKFLGNDQAVDIGTVLGYPPRETVLNDEYLGDGEDGI